jgi:cobyrinic acid a,c-diamide synthase
MFHRSVTGVSAYSLDPFFLDSEGIYNALSKPGVCVIEGAMGYYDGIGATSECSSYTVASASKTPVVLILNAASTGASLGAAIEGFAGYRPDSGIKGVIFNNLNPSRYLGMEKLALGCGVEPLGYLPKRAEFEIKSRRLGLMTATEVFGLSEKIGLLGRQAEETLDIDGLLALADSACALPAPQPVKRLPGNPMLAVAKDEAFCFRYEENLELLEEMGCAIKFFSPIRDSEIPMADGLHLCGGYPELHIRELSENKAMLASVKDAVLSGMPTIAECGGFMYLQRSIGGHPVVGAIEGNSFETSRLQNFGYLTLTALHNTLLCNEGETLKAHEFHYWDTDSEGSSFLAEKASDKTTRKCVHATSTLHAGFPHIHLNPKTLERFHGRMTNAHK